MTEPDLPDGTSLEPPPGRTRVGGYAICLDEGGRILLARLSAIEAQVGSWTLPGGGIDFGEHPDAAAIRELEEETGLEGVIEEVAGIFSHVYPKSAFAGGGDLHFLGIIYRVRVTGGVLRDEMDGSTDTCAWLRLDEVRAVRLTEVGRFGAGLAFPDASL